MYLLAALCTAFGLAVSLTISQGGKDIVTVTLGGPHGTPTTEVTVPAGAVDSAGDVAQHDGLRSENPAGVTAAQLDAAREQQEKLAQSDQLPIVTPDAAPSQRGCTTKLVQDYSSRRGVRPRLFVLHYTVSPNRVGWSDVWSVVSLFDRISFQASSNYVIDNEGHCAYIVRESDKAWTQAAANPVSISVEVINSGHEATYAKTLGLKKIALVASDAMKRWAIPVQLGAVSGCTVKRAGLVDHGSLGACGGGHHDISPYSVRSVLAAIKAQRAAEAGTKVAVKPAPKPLPLLRCTVKNLQTRLHVTADGIVGPKTRAAIAAFQKAHHWRVTGKAGAKVGAALRLTGCSI
jgi:peptidoglycan hydrolase-like protein with peptidoglycan-binding domain